MKSRTVSEVLAKAAEYEENEKYEQAYECYKDAYEYNKSDEEVLSKLAITAQMLHYKEDAIKYWNILISLNPANQLPYNQLLDLYFADNKYDYYLTRAKLKTLENRLEQATVDYKKALSNTTDEESIITARYLLAQTYEILDKPMQAIDEYLRILDYDHNENVYSALAKIYYNTDKSAAVGVLRQALEKYPQNTIFKELLSKIYMELGDYEKAYEFAAEDFTKAKILLLQEKNDEALEILKKLSDKEKNTPKFIALMAEYYYNKNDDEKTLECINKYETLDAESPLASQMRALVYEKQNNDFEAHYNWGKYYLKKSSFDLALNEFLSAHNCNKNDVNTIKELISLYISLDDNVASIEFSEKLVALEKDDVPTLKKLVKFYEEQGYQEKMIQYLLLLSEINPRDYDALLSLAKFYESNRQMTEAIEYYQNYLKYAPTSDMREKIDNKVKLLTTGEGVEEEGFLDKLLGFFSKK